MPLLRSMRPRKPLDEVHIDDALVDAGWMYRAVSDDLASMAALASVEAAAAKGAFRRCVWARVRRVHDELPRLRCARATDRHLVWRLDNF